MSGFIIFIIIVIVLYNRKMKLQQNVKKQINAKPEVNDSVYTQSSAKQTVRSNPKSTKKSTQKTTTKSAASSKSASDGAILERANKNVARYEQDMTLAEMEKEHKHSEKESATISKEQFMQNKLEHPHDSMHVAAVVENETESMLGTIDDLMIKGYAGNLSFERDFLGEAMDMINQFTYSSAEQNS